MRAAARRRATSGAADNYELRPVARAQPRDRATERPTEALNRLDCSLITVVRGLDRRPGLAERFLERWVGTEVDRLALELAAEDHGGVDLVADREHERLAYARGGAGPLLGERDHVRVAIRERRQAELLRHQVGELGRRIFTLSEANGSDLCPGRIPRFVDRVYRGGEQGSLVETRNSPLSAVVNIQIGVDRAG